MNLEQAKRNFNADKSEQNAATLIRMCMRSGLIPEQNVRYCAGLGDSVCSIIFPKEYAYIRDVFYSFEWKFHVEFSIWCARKALRFWEEEYLDDNKPRLAIEAAEAWLIDPSRENRKKAMSAHWSVREIAFSLFNESSYSLSPRSAAFAASAAAYAAADSSSSNLPSTAWSVSTHSAVALSSEHHRVKSEEVLIEYLMKDIL